MGKEVKSKSWFIKIAPNVDKFKKEIWSKIPGEKKVEYAWEMVVEVMEIKGQRNRLRFKKILKLPQRNIVKKNKTF